MSMTLEQCCRLWVSASESWRPKWPSFTRSAGASLTQHDHSAPSVTVEARAHACRCRWSGILNAWVGVDELRFAQLLQCVFGVDMLADHEELLLYRRAVAAAVPIFKPELEAITWPFVAYTAVCDKVRVSKACQ